MWVKRPDHEGFVDHCKNLSCTLDEGRNPLEGFKQRICIFGSCFNNCSD